MSTASLPSYIAPSLSRIPTYTAEPQEFEQRLALSDRRRRPFGNFIKQSKSGDVKLCLTGQEADTEFPVYGSAATVDGTVELSKTEGATSVEVKLEGRLKIHELAEGGSTSIKLCLDSALLWTKNPSNHICPSSLAFRLTLPPNFTWDGKTYPLPPTYSVKLSGLPGFNASIEYSVNVIINKPNSLPPLVPFVKSSLLGIGSIGNIIVSTPCIYHPRTRSAVPLPLPLIPSINGFQESPDWRLEESVIRCKKEGGQDIISKFYIPASRILCMSQPIPFHLTLQSSSHSLAAFLPCSPTTRSMSGKRPTQVQLMRQSTVDVRNEEIMGTKTDIWRVDCIGVGTFKHAGDGPSWISFTGEIAVEDSVKVPGFRVGGLSVKDYILLTVNPPDLKKTPFEDMRQIVPIRLTTDPWSPSRPQSESSIPSRNSLYGEDVDEKHE